MWGHLTVTLLLALFAAEVRQHCWQVLVVQQHHALSLQL
jgi:hypothetical protein